MGDDRERSKAKSVGPAVAWLLLASLLALPALSAVRTVCAAAAFLVEFLSEGRLPLLSALTPNPARAPLADRPVPIDLYRPLTLGTPPALVLVHGLAPMGKDDPRLAQAARLLARAGFRVAVPTIPGLTRLRLRPEDAEPVVAAIRSLPGGKGSGPGPPPSPPGKNRDLRRGAGAGRPPGGGPPRPPRGGPPPPPPGGSAVLDLV